MVVAVLVILAPLLLYAAVTNTYNPPHQTRPSINLVGQQWQNGNLTFNLVSTRDAQNIVPADLSYIVSSANGTTYFSGAEGSQTGVGGVTVTVGYLDSADDSAITPDDQIRLSVQPTNSAALRGGTFRVIFETDTVGTAPVPG